MRRRGLCPSCSVAMLLLAGMVAGCNEGGDSTSAAEDRAPLAVRVMTYNVLNGAGVETLYPENQQWASERGYPGNRLSTVLDIIKSVDPDVLGVQEANQWELGEPPVAQRVADELGMSYVIGPSGNPESGYANVVLCSRHPIQASETYPGHFSRGGVRADLLLPNGNLLHVFVAHFHSWDYGARMEELSFMAGTMAPYQSDYTLLMGDMNFVDPGDEADALRAAGWTHVAGPPTFCATVPLDQFWVGPALVSNVTVQPYVPETADCTASDHLPLVIEVSIPVPAARR